MALTGKHTFGEIEGTRVTFIEKAIDKSRLDFFVELLQHNGFQTLVQENPPKKEEDVLKYTLGVTDMSFNPTIAVYQRKLKTKEGIRVTPDYWNQVSEADSSNPQYYRRRPEPNTEPSS